MRMSGNPLADLARDPDIKQENHVIQSEFAISEMDGLTKARASPWTGKHSLSLILVVTGLVLMASLTPSNLRLDMWMGTMAFLALFGIIAGKGVTGQWLGLLIDTRNKVSLARFQMTLWTILILSAYLTAVMVNVDMKQPEPMAIAIPSDLWLLMGISITSLIGSPMILSAKKGREAKEPDRQRALNALNRQAVDPDQVAIIGHLVINQIPEAAKWADMFQGSEIGNVGLLDLGKMQMFFFTLILVLSYASALSALFQQGRGPIQALPVVDGGMLALLGISHAGYLVNKALPHSDSE